jgi:hypothetical protein
MQSGLPDPRHSTRCRHNPGEAGPSLGGCISASNVRKSLASVETYSQIMQRVLAALAAESSDVVGTGGALTALGRVVADLFERTNQLSSRVERGEDVTKADVLEVEQISTVASASNLLCAAHVSGDPFLFEQARMRGLAIASMLDEIVEAGTRGEGRLAQVLRDDVADALEALTALVRPSDRPV